MQTFLKAAIFIAIPLALGLIGSTAPMRLMQDDIAATYLGAALGILGIVLGIIVAFVVNSERS